MKTISLKLMTGAATALLIGAGAVSAQDNSGGKQGQNQGQGQTQMMKQGQGAGDEASRNTVRQKQQKQGQGKAKQAESGGQKSTDRAERRADDGSGKQSRDNKAASKKEMNKTEVNKKSVTTKNKTVIRQKIVEKRVEPARDVDFNISVGVAVPSTIMLHPLPPDIVTVAPEYEGYDFFVLADGTIVIVNPATLEIVTVIAA